MNKKLAQAARWAFRAWNTGSAEEQNEAFKSLDSSGVWDSVFQYIEDCYPDFKKQEATQ